jgi:hypothetical protein
MRLIIRLKDSDSTERIIEFDDMDGTESNNFDNSDDIIRFWEYQIIPVFENFLEAFRPLEYEKLEYEKEDELADTNEILNTYKDK